VIINSSQTPSLGLHDIPLTGAPVAFRVLPDGTHFLVLESDGTIESFTASITGIPPATLSQAATQICPMTVGHSTPIQINLGQGKIDPINFFVSADGNLALCGRPRTQQHPGLQLQQWGPQRHSIARFRITPPRSLPT